MEAKDTVVMEEVEKAEAVAEEAAAAAVEEEGSGVAAIAALSGAFVSPADLRTEGEARLLEALGRWERSKCSKCSE